MASKLYIICGHGAGDPGACAGGKTEADMVRAFAKACAAANKNVEVLDTTKNWYASSLVNSALKKKVGSNPVVEIHMDSAAASAKGGHVIIASGLSADSMDTALSKWCKANFPGRSSIIVKRSDLANINRAKAQGINYRLVELCFISNSEDRSKLEKNMTALAKSFVACFGLSSTSTATASAPKSVKYQITTASGVNVRTNAGTGVNCKIVRTYAKGKTVTVTETKTVSGNTWGKTSDGWFAIKYNGSTYAKKC